MSALALALLAASAAEPQAELVEGQSALSACLGDAACGDRVQVLLGETMAEYGLLLQAEPMGADALAGRGWGPTFSLHFDTAALGPRNELERAVPVVPGLPRLGVGWLLGPTSVRPDRPQLALSTQFLPPVRLAGGRLSTAQIDASAAAPVLGPWLWLGGGLGYNASRVELPLFGYTDQLESIEAETGHPVARTEACSQTPCVDVYAQQVASLRLGLALEPTPALFAYARGSLAVVRSRLELDYDGTTWRLDPVQLQGHTGLGLRAGGYQLTAGLTAVPRPPMLSTDGSRHMLKAMLATTWRLGPEHARRAEASAAERPPLPE